MAKDNNDLAPVLLAIGRQIAGRNGGVRRADRPERDLPTLFQSQALIRNPSGERTRPDREPPVLVQPTLPEEQPPPPAPVARPQRKEAAYRRILVDPLPGHSA